MTRQAGARLVLGLFFVIVGGANVLGPVQNFLYVVRSYHLFPPGFDTAVAYAVPWAEFLLGVFLFLGLWLKRVLQGYILIIAGFLLILGQALVRRLPLDDCGCFGSLIHVPPYVTIGFDFLLMVIVIWLYRHREKTQACSLDRYFAGSS